jgi:uncharacterized protein with FMN-binding domain
MRTSTTTLTTAAMALALSLSACSDTTPPSGNAPSTTPEGENAMTQPPSDAAAATEFADGEYSATGWYGSLPSHHDVTLTIESGAVTDVEITTPAEDETSLGYQQRFAAALPEAIVGKDVADLAVDRLAGSSGCSEGFMDALAKNKEEAAL